MPELVWDGQVRCAQVEERLLPWEHPAIQACVRQYADTPRGHKLAFAKQRSALHGPEGLRLTHLVGVAEGTAWPGCDIWMGEPLTQGTSGAIRLGFCAATETWPAGLVAVKAMRTRPVLQEMDWEPAWDDKPQDAAPTPTPSSGFFSPFAAMAQQDAALASPAAAVRGSASAQSLAPSSASSTLECSPERIVEEAECQRTYSPSKLPVWALLHDETSGMHYMVMRWMGGGSLHREGIRKLPDKSLAALGRLVLHSIATDLYRLSPAGMPAEELRSCPAGLAHDDIKPLNLFFDRDTIALGDWDIARGSVHASSTGTPRYMAPERFPFGTASGAADMWSLGASLVELFNRNSPFAGASCSQPGEGNDAHADFATFYAALFASDAPKRLDKGALNARLQALHAAHPTVVDWLQPMCRADGRLCEFVLRHLPASGPRISA